MYVTAVILTHILSFTDTINTNKEVAKLSVDPCCCACSILPESSTICVEIVLIGFGYMYNLMFIHCLLFTCRSQCTKLDSKYLFFEMVADVVCPAAGHSQLLKTEI